MLKRALIYGKFRTNGIYGSFENGTRWSRLMSMYPPHYAEPIFKKDSQNMEKYELAKLSHVPIKAALNSSSDTIFNAELKQKMLAYIVKCGNSRLARELLTKTFEQIKRAQIERKHLVKQDNGHAICIDAEKLLIQAIENSRPLLQLSSIKRGGVKYQVPVPLTSKKSYFYAMKWILDAAKEKDRKISLSSKLAWEILDAAHGQGRVIKKKNDLHRLCENNRAYAHYRWS
ncbi:28S ribosomal protein S7, mitochondrial [Scaptodrosophila lebanonensis]|uniref:28S ribosomal protein S7, mitochondrial n=1 Tax=Drosophila lebanonensis TaxID=7225 RepID=A0A6J2U3V9_DROLE|nr:28S ribosomal protein S7, mitochondrial [Scaptodrosophila lebanonensis]